LSAPKKGTKYTELTLSTLANDISTVSELFYSSTINSVNAETGCVELSSKCIGNPRVDKPSTQGTDADPVAKNSGAKLGGDANKNKKKKTKADDDCSVKRRGRPLKIVAPVLLDVTAPKEGADGFSTVKNLRDSKKQQDYILHKDKNAMKRAHRYKYECRLCQKICRGWASWYHHWSTHLDKRPDFICPTCGWKTKTKAGMWAHRKKHTDVSVKCPHCDYTNCIKSAINTHIMQVHPELSPKKLWRHLCDTCGREFKTSSNLSSHMKLHKQLIRNQVCSLCKKSFYSKKLLQDHVRSVHEEKRHKCDKCDNKFAKRLSLLVHIDRVHLRIKKIPCDYDDCDQLFYEKKDLKQHIMVYHTKEKNYNCQWQGCDNVFRTLYQSKIHMRIHTDEKPLKCPHPNCDYSARQRSSLTCHLKKHEPENAYSIPIMSRTGRTKRTPATVGAAPKNKAISFVGSIPGPTGTIFDLLPLPVPQTPQGLLTFATQQTGVFSQVPQLQTLPGLLPVSSLSTDVTRPPVSFTTVPVLTAKQGTAELAFPGAELDKHLRFKATLINVEDSGKPKFTTTILDAPDPDTEATEFTNVPVQQPGNPSYTLIPDVITHQSVPSMMTVPVFTEEELMNMASLPMLPTQQPMSVTMETSMPTDPPKPLTTEPVITIDTSRGEQPKYLSMPIFTDDGFQSADILKTDADIASQEQNANAVSINTTATIKVPVVTPDEYFKTDTAMSSVATEHRQRPVLTAAAVSLPQVEQIMPGLMTDLNSPVFTTVSTSAAHLETPPGTISPVFPAQAVSTSHMSQPGDPPGTITTPVLPSQAIQGGETCSSLVLGALRQLDPSFQTVQLHQLVQQPQLVEHPLPVTTGSSHFTTNFLSDSSP
jgi:KRAB domain-containing zinc finger protein